MRLPKASVSTKTISIYKTVPPNPICLDIFRKGRFSTRNRKNWIIPPQSSEVWMSLGDRVSQPFTRQWYQTQWWQVREFPILFETECDAIERLVQHRQSLFSNFKEWHMAVIVFFGSTSIVVASVLLSHADSALFFCHQHHRGRAWLMFAFCFVYQESTFTKKASVSNPRYTFSKHMISYTL